MVNVDRTRQTTLLLVI